MLYEVITDDIRIMGIDAGKQGVRISLFHHDSAEIICILLQAAAGIMACHALALTFGKQYFRIRFEFFTFAGGDDFRGPQIDIEGLGFCADDFIIADKNRDGNFFVQQHLYRT